MDAVRLNFSHGTHEEHAARAAIIARRPGRARPAARADRRSPGAELRVGALAEPRLLVAGEAVVSPRGDRAQAGDLLVAPAVIGDVLAPGHDVLIDDGLIRLARRGRPRAAAPAAASSSAARSRSNKGVNLPGVHVPIPSLTEKDLAISTSRSGSASTSSHSRSSGGRGRQRAEGS